MATKIVAVLWPGIGGHPPGEARVFKLVKPGVHYGPAWRFYKLVPVGSKGTKLGRRPDVPGMK